jgi:GNAT superfamily N-acetyltransferase
MSVERIEIEISLRYEATRYLRNDDDKFLLTMGAEVIGSHLCAHTAEAEFKLGYLRMYLVQVGNALNANADLSSIFDIHQGTADIGSHLFNSSFDDFRPWIKRRFDDAFPWEDILILDRLALIPAVRGQQLGLAVLHQAIEDWSSGCSLVAMKPFPLQYEGGGRSRQNITNLKLEGLLTNKAESFRRLRAYYAKLGFERAARSEIFVLSTKELRPSLQSIGIPDQFTASRELLLQTPLSKSSPHHD